MLSPNLIKIDNRTPFIVDMMYATSKNISGCAVYKEIGFGSDAYIHIDLWQRLEKLIPVLQQKGLLLKIRDAYRPVEAHERLLQLVPIEGLFAVSPEKSQHCRGTAIDVILCTTDGKELEFQSPIDCYTPYYASELAKGRDKEYKQFLQTARHDYNETSAIAVNNRKLLREMMEGAGLQIIPHEWWHYNLPNGNTDKYPAIFFNKE